MKWPLTIVDTKSGAEIKLDDIDDLSLFLGKKAIEKPDGTIEVADELYLGNSPFGSIWDLEVPK